MTNAARPEAHPRARFFGSDAVVVATIIDASLAMPVLPRGRAALPRLSAADSNPDRPDLFH